MQKLINREIYLVRHSESTKNVNNLFGDESAMFGLTEKGVADTEILANKIASIVSKNFNSYNFYSSPDIRSTATANILTTLLNNEFQIINSLLPIHAGILSGINEEKADIDYPELMRKKKLFRDGKLDGYAISYPNGENVKDFQDRVISDFKNILAINSNNLFIVTHQSVITALLSFFYSELKGYKYYYYFKLDLSSLTKILITDNKFNIVQINITL